MSKRYVGFDIGNGTVKLVYFSGKKLKKTIYAQVPENLVVNGEIKAMDAMADFLKETAKENSVPLHSGACVIIPSSLVFVKNVSFPLMNDQQVRYNLPFEFKDYLVQEKGQYIFDYSVLGTDSDPQTGEPGLKIFACAVLRSTIDSYREMFKRAGFSLKIAVPQEEAISAVMHRYIAGGVEDKNYCIVDVGQAAINVKMYHGSEHMVSNNLELGMKEIDYAIADIFDVDIHIAHTYLLSNYMNVLNDQRCLEIYRRMAIEIMRSIHFFNYNNRDAALKDVFICGGGIEVKPLYEEMKTMIEEFGTDGEPLRTLHPVGELLPQEVSEPWRYLSAYGCALLR